MAKTLVLVHTATAFLAPSFAPSPRRGAIRVSSSAVEEDEAALLNFYTLKADAQALKDAQAAEESWWLDYLERKAVVEEQRRKQEEIEREKEAKKWRF